MGELRGKRREGFDWKAECVGPRCELHRKCAADKKRCAWQWVLLANTLTRLATYASPSSSSEESCLRLFALDGGVFLDFEACFVAAGPGDLDADFSEPVASADCSSSDDSSPPTRARISSSTSAIVSRE